MRPAATQSSGSGSLPIDGPSRSVYFGIIKSIFPNLSDGDGIMFFSLIIGLCVWGFNLMAAPQALPFAEFAEAWDYTLSQPGGLPPLVEEPGKGTIFAPELKIGERAVLTSKQPLPLQPYHQYRLELDVRGALFVKWRAAMLFNTTAGATVRHPLFPLVTDNAIPPPPAWETRHFDFIVPGEVKTGRLEFIWEAVTAGPQRPGLANLRLTDFGAVLDAATKGATISRFNAGFEEPAAEDGTGPGWEFGKVMRDPAGAHGGAQFLRLEINNTRLGIGEVDLSAQPAPVVLRVSAWVRGKGRCSFNTMLSQPPPYWRLQNLESPTWPLTETWSRLSWDFTLAPQNPLPAGISINLRLYGKQLDLDDVELRQFPAQSAMQKK